MSDHPKSDGPIQRPRPHRTLAIDGAPPSAELPFESNDGASSVPPPSIESDIDDEDTFIKSTPDEARMTAAMPAIRGPDLTPNWAQNPSGFPPDEETLSRAEDDGRPTFVIKVPRPGRRREQEIDLETYAGLRATLDCRPHDEPEVLEAADLRRDEWTRTKDRWETLLAATARQGDETHLSRFDRAYVARIDDERGELYGLVDFAQFEAAAEAGQGDAKLEEQRVPSAAKMPLRRQWLRAIMADDLLRSRYYAEVDKARG